MRDVFCGPTIDKGILPDGTGTCIDLISEKNGWIYFYTYLYRANKNCCIYVFQNMNDVNKKNLARG
jgi:hypothetical protein